MRRLSRIAVGRRVAQPTDADVVEVLEPITKPPQIFGTATCPIRALHVQVDYLRFARNLGAIPRRSDDFRGYWPF